jgi:para-nitrobenzyl esterase
MAERAVRSRGRRLRDLRVRGLSERPAPVAAAPAGRASGRWRGAVAAFLGIPFARPPVGPLRWRPPLRLPRWEGTFRADRFGPAPLQPQPPRDSIMFHTNFNDRRPLVMSEDCLYLNVWSAEPARGAGLPVMVWIHGGGNRYGHGSQDIHNGRSIAARGTVVVTLNHRLGALGFLAHPELAGENGSGASGNYALADILAVLEWVQENIHAFGGDPRRVTLAGNSAGAAHVSHLMAAPAAAGLFHAAIGQSAAGLFRAEGPLPERRRAEQAGTRFAATLGGRDLAGLRRLCAAELAVAGHFGPVLDGRLLTEQTQAVFGAGRQHPVPLLVGSNTDEGVNYTRPGTVDEVAARSREDPGGAFARAYPVADAQTAWVSARRFVGESRFAYPVWRWARTHRQTSGAAVWQYRFDRPPPLPSGVDLAPPPDGHRGYGAYHTAELPYTADNLEMLPFPWQECDRALAAAMGDAWARFVTGHDPGGGGLPAWPVVRPADDSPVLVFGETLRVAPVDRLAAMHALDALPRPL